MAALSHPHPHLHLLLARPRQTLAWLPLPSSSSRALAVLRRVSAPRCVPVLCPVAALGGGGGGLADVGQLFGRVEAFLYTVVDAAVSASVAPDAAATEGGAKEAAGDWLSGITNSMETVLKIIEHKHFN